MEPRLSPPLLLVVRHAPVAVAGVCYGQSDVPTLLDADAASRAILTQVAHGPLVSHIWTSPWQRTHKPAQILADTMRLPLTIDARLSELSFGAWEGRSYADLEANDTRFAEWMRAWQSQSPPQGESVRALIERVRSWWREVSARQEVALIVTHAGVIRALRALSRGLAYTDVVGEPVVPLNVERVNPSKTP